MENKKINNKYSKFVRYNLVPYLRNIKPQYRYLYDELTAKYINKEIRNESQIERLIKQLVKRPSAVIASLKKEKKPPKIRAKPIEVARKFHLNASIEIRTIWYSKIGVGISDKEAAEITRINANYGPEMEHLPNDIARRIQTQIYYDYQDYGRTFFEPNVGSALNLLKDLIHEDLTEHTNYGRVDVFIKGIKVLDESKLTKKNIKKMKMLASSHTQYSFIDEDQSKLINNDCCVLDIFLATYPHVLGIGIFHVVLELIVQCRLPLHQPANDTRPATSKHFAGDNG